MNIPDADWIDFMVIVAAAVYITFLCITNLTKE